MPSGIYKRTEETRKKMSERMKKNPINYWQGKKRSTEDILKMSLSHKGKLTGDKNPSKRPEVRLKISQAKKGVKLSEQAKRNIALGCIGRKQSPETIEKRVSHFRGEKSHFWRSGITPINLKIRGSIEYKLWRISIFTKDNFTCKKCNDDAGGNLVAHHILNFTSHKELRFAINNGITLCVNCHNKFHKIYGTRNNTHKQVEKYLNGKTENIIG